jgi:hypothetical protein
MSSQKLSVLIELPLLVNLLEYVLQYIIGELVDE